MRTHYDNLHISEKASPEVIRAAYKALAQKWHPDKNPDQREKAERYFKIITNAFNVLSDPVARAKYDAWLKQQRSEQEQKQPTDDTLQTNRERQQQRADAREAERKAADQARMAEAWEDGNRSREQGFSERDCPYSGELAGAWQGGFKSGSPAVAKSSLLGRLWRGEEGLGKTFWLYGVAGFVLVFSASIFIAVLFADNRGDIAGIIRSAQDIYLAYFVFISICTLRSLKRRIATPNQGPAMNEPGAITKPFVQRLVDGELQARYAIIWGVVIPTIALSVFFRIALEKPDYAGMTIRVYALSSLHLITAAYIIWSAKNLDSGSRKRIIIWASLLWAFFVISVAASF